MSDISEKHPIRVSRLLRNKAQDFLNSRRTPKYLQEIVEHFDSGADTIPCLLALELVFSSLLKDRFMVVEIIPLKPVEKTPENQYKLGLQSLYDKCFQRMLECMEGDSMKVRLQALASVMVLLSAEAKSPLEGVKTEPFVPQSKMRSVLMKVLSIKNTNMQVVSKFADYMVYDDVLAITWKLLPGLTAKSNPCESYIVKYFILLGKMGVTSSKEPQFLFQTDGSKFEFDESLNKKCLNKIWHCVMQWEHSLLTHKQLLIVLLEKVLVHLEKPLLLTDFLMDSLDVGGPVSLLALQGIFTMIQVHNLDYPNIFAKLYSMFEPEIFHTKYKARLFYLSDIFLSSTHLPENLVAAFIKRLARLALIAPSEDIIIICHFIGNLIIRHPGLKCLLHNAASGQHGANTDPYIMEERDPIKSNAIQSSLWEIHTLQHHVMPNVAMAARFISIPLPSVEWDVRKLLENSPDDMFDKEMKKVCKLIVLQFDKPIRKDDLTQYWAL